MVEEVCPFLPLFRFGRKLDNARFSQGEKHLLLSFLIDQRFWPLPVSLSYAGIGLRVPIP